MEAVVPPEVIRNFSIISHVDHGKSTLSDRILELTFAVDPRDMRAQFLDSMDLERERGITIKAQNVRVRWRDHILQLIDTPGHVDFGYEVSRSLAACEGVVLLVDASQGIEAQTLANCYLALEHDLEIVAALNKIDLPAADPDRYAEEIERVLGLPADQILRISAKTGEGVPNLLDDVVRRIPAPKGNPDDRLRALLFDSYYDQYRGVVSAVRVVDGTLSSGARLRFLQTGAIHEVEEVGIRTPAPVPVDALGPGEVGYLIAGIKDVGEARVGETVTEAARPANDPSRATRTRSRWSSAACTPSTATSSRTCATRSEKLKLNDASVTYEPETSAALGFGFRCGFLGLLHMEIVRERLEREFGLSLIATAPSVEYVAHLTNGEEPAGRQPLGDARAAVHRPHRRAVAEADDHHARRVHRHDHGPVPDAPGPHGGDGVPLPRTGRAHLHAAARRGRARLLRRLKSRTKGYASLDYEPAGSQTDNLVKVDILLAGQPVDAFSTIVHRSKADDYGRKMTAKLRELIPRQLFDVPIQAAIGGRIIARETVKAKRKDVLAKCYGGDITRKRKLLEKQKEGKRG